MVLSAPTSAEILRFRDISVFFNSTYKIEIVSRVLLVRRHYKIRFSVTKYDSYY